MDRFASNTLRTLAIVAISIVVIIASLGLILLALCFGMLGNLGGSGHHDPQVIKFLIGALAAAAVLITFGVASVAKLARGINRESALPPLHWNVREEPPSHAPVNPPPGPESPVSTPPPVPTQAAAPPALPRPAALQPHSSIDVVTHLSPASRLSIQRLVLAIVAQVATHVVPVVLGWRWALRTLPTYHQALWTTFLAVLATNLPYLVLLFSLLRRPGRRAFAYALAIPSLLLLWGIFGSSVTIFYVLRMTHSSASFLMLVPWVLHALILYLAWKAIRLTGIFPNPARILVAAVVVVFYYALLPVLLVVLRYSKF
jgi:NADH:ubiquinone oxidoreductase subunit K